MKAYRCMSCGEGMVRRVQRPGRFGRYLAVHNVPIPEDLALPECDHCGEMYLDEEDDATLTKALETEYRRLALAKAQNALADLSRSGIRERRVEALLCLSPNYLSRIRAGKDTSGSLATVLLLLADNPSLIDRAEALWQTDAHEARFVGTLETSQQKALSPFEDQHFVGPAA